MKRLTTVTIGIPALNEEANIGSLLQKLLTQDTSTYSIDKIIVISDASTDQTDAIVTGLGQNNTQIELIRNPIRQGCQYNQNLVFEQAISDIVVLIDADHLPLDDQTIANLIQPILTQQNISLTGGNTIPTKAKNFVQSILNFAIIRNRDMFKSINNGKTYFLCPGGLRAFKQDLYRKLRFPKIAGEDMYSFMFAVQNNFGFAYAPNAIAYFNTPSTIADHEKQSTRFVHAQANLRKIFGKEFTQTYEKASTKAILRHIVTSFVHNPFLMVSYICLLTYMRMRAIILPSKTNGLWEVVSSSKSNISGEQTV